MQQRNVGFLSILKNSLLGRELDLSTGSIRDTIAVLSIPMILEMVMESLFSVVDVFFVGRLGIDAVATVGLTESLMSIVYSIAIGIGMGGTAIIARRIGEKKNRKAADAVVQIIIVAILLSAVIGAVGYWFSPQLLSMLGASPNLISVGSEYTKIIFAGNIAVTLLFVINGIFRGAGNAATAMKVLWIANIINIILNPLLIFGVGFFPELGLKGSAIATVIGRSMGVLLQVYILLFKNSTLRISKRNLVIKYKTIKKIVSLSFGGMSQFLIEAVSWIFLIRIVAEFGSSVVAGYTIAYRILIFTILPGWGLANAAATLVGQNLGSGNPIRAEAFVWKSIKYNVIFLGIVTLLFLFAGKMVVSLFANEGDVLFHGTVALKLFSIGFVFFACGMVVSQSLNGAGDTRTPTYINVLVFLLIQIPLAWFLADVLQLKANGVYISIAISYALHALLNVLAFRSGKWKLVKV